MKSSAVPRKSSAVPRKSDDGRSADIQLEKITAQFGEMQQLNELLAAKEGPERQALRDRMEALRLSIPKNLTKFWTFLHLRGEMKLLASSFSMFCRQWNMCGQVRYEEVVFLLCIN